jgi:hypothetical protein
MCHVFRKDHVFGCIRPRLINATVSGESVLVSAYTVTLGYRDTTLIPLALSAAMNQTSFGVISSNLLSKSLYGHIHPGLPLGFSDRQRH